MVKIQLVSEGVGQVDHETARIINILEEIDTNWSTFRSLYDWISVHVVPVTRYQSSVPRKLLSKALDRKGRRTKSPASLWNG